MVSDNDLHARFVAGDKVAGGELCRRHFDAICAYFERRLPTMAEDLAQEVFVVYARAPEKMTGSSVRAFLYGIARNVLLHALRWRSRHPEAELPEMSILDVATGVSTIVAAHEVTRLFLEALQSLSMIHQDLVELFFFEGLTVAEASVALGIPENTCRSRRFRAIAALRERVAELELDPRRVAVALTKLGQLRREQAGGPGGGLGMLRELFADVSAADLRQMIGGDDGDAR
jgi:RNA polymerase sigma-70 factor (ECF subfamily)